MMPFKKHVETTYADLRPTDLVIDKSGQAWPIDELIHESDEESGFWLCDPVTKVKMHFLRKPAGDPVTVSRVPDQAKHPTPMDAVEAVQAGLIGESEVVVEYTEKEADAAKAATDDSPVQLPAFEDMTILEMRSHLYLLHGVFAHDMRSRNETIGMHERAHVDHEAGKLNSRHVPHVHEVK